MTTIFSYNNGHGSYPLNHGGAYNGSFTTQADYFNNSGNYWCETCDKGFQTAHQLEKHKSAHQKCNIDGCQFIAHPNIITKHIQMQHATGLYKRIAKLNDPEEIKKWREERKKKYPTKQNIEKKAAQIKEKVARGEKMGMFDSRKNRRPFGSFPNKKNTTHRSYDSKNMNDRNRNKLGFRPEKSCNIILPTAEESRTLKPFGGLQDLMMDESDDEHNKEEINSNDLIEEDEYVSETPIEDERLPDNSETKVCGALTSLICNYGSSDEENSDTEQKETMSSKEKKLEPKTKKSEVKDIQLLNSEKPNGLNLGEPKAQNLVEEDKAHEMDDDSGPEETKIVKIDNNEPQNNGNEIGNSITKKNKNKLLVNMKNKPNFRHDTFRRKLPSTLLEKLLFKEIQKERNIVLQCIRHIVQNNFFKSS
ncbi:nuclear fragile X mental retardation-interacting protein 1 [Aricia agestis]|uniref:nuclear fragile X mental retardation-interacting protein 1 n=1 Tax=Aricia agestis TaxID=91739 RepID=UPI001C209E73|nr:nuclear fragile X mental retardation-interacting protein 1 [Aricia agestis]